MENNELRQIPAAIAKLLELDMLALSDNKIKTMKGDYSTLQNLYFFDVSSNKLRMFPKGVTNLTKLYNLALAFNDIKKIPESIGKMQGLSSLQLDGNQLSILPLGLTKLTNLNYLSLEGNPLPNGWAENYGTYEGWSDKDKTEISVLFNKIKEYHGVKN